MPAYINQACFLFNVWIRAGFMDGMRIAALVSVANILDFTTLPMA